MIMLEHLCQYCHYFKVENDRILSFPIGECLNKKELGIPANEILYTEPTDGLDCIGWKSIEEED